MNQSALLTHPNGESCSAGMKTYCHPSLLNVVEVVHILRTAHACGSVVQPVRVLVLVNVHVNILANVHDQ